MKKQDKLKKELEKLEEYILGDLDKGKLDVQIIDCINNDREENSQKIRRILKWVLEDKYQKSSL